MGEDRRKNIRSLEDGKQIDEWVTELEQRS